MVENYGIKAFQFSKSRYHNYFRIEKKPWKAYLPPGGVYRFKVRVPGVKQTLASQYDKNGEFRYGDYGLVIVCRGDYAFVKAAGAPDNTHTVQPKQQLAVKRTSTTTSTVSRFSCGRVGFITDAPRADTAIPAGAITKPEVVESKLVVKQEAF
jgi:hypothetical protein